MTIKQGLLVSVLGTILFTGIVSANETTQRYETTSKSDKADVSSPGVSPNRLLPNEFVGELRTDEIYKSRIPEKPEQNKVDLTKAMIGKFRINGI